MKNVFCMKNNYIIFLFIFIISLVSFYQTIIRFSVVDNNDTAAYITGGISYINEKLPAPIAGNSESLNASQIIYPSFPFQIIAAFLADTQNKNIYISNIVLMSFVIFFLTNIVLYFIANIYLSSTQSVIFVLSIALIPLFFLYPRTAIRPLTDTYLLLFFYCSIYFYLKDHFWKSILFASIAIIFRSQALMLIPFIIITKKDKTLKNILYIIIPIASNIFSSLIINHVLYLDAASNYYNFNMLFLLKNTMSNFGITFKSFINFSENFPFIILFPFSIAVYFKNNIYKGKRFILFSIVIFVLIFFFSWHSMSVFYKSGHDPRYFVYSLPLLVLSFFISIKNVKIYTRFIVRICMCITILYSIVIFCIFPFKTQRFLSNLTSLDLIRNTTIESIGKNAKILIISELWKYRAILMYTYLNTSARHFAYVDSSSKNNTLLNISMYDLIVTDNINFIKHYNLDYLNSQCVFDEKYYIRKE